MIPQRIIQIWGGDAALPLLAQCAVANVRLLNPNYEYLLFDDDRMEQFVSDKCPEYRDVFHSFHLAVQRYDFFRYLAVSELGGFYFDIDVMFASSLQPLLDHRCVFPFEELTLNRYLRSRYAMDWEIGNYAFGAVPKHPFLEAIIKNCIRAQHDPDWVRPMAEGLPRLLRSNYRVLYTTGPALLSRTLADNPLLATDVTVLFPDDVCDATQWNQFGTYGIHLKLNSWYSGGNFVIRRLAAMSESRARRTLHRDSLKMGKRRSAMRAKS